MLIELSKETFIKIKPLIGDLSHYLILSALLDGKTPGRIWVNNSEAPTTAFVWDKVNTLFFLVGDSKDYNLNQEINHLIINTIFPEAIQRQYAKFYLQFAPYQQWKEQVDVILKGSLPERQFIYSYILSPDHSDSSLMWQQHVPAGYKMSRITHEIINNTNLKNLDSVVYGINTCWSSIDQYLDDGGIGFCLLKEDVITSWCSTDYVINAECELYIETYKGYKQQGLGTLVAIACIKECITKGLMVHWHCFNYAIGSVKIAEKIKLTKIAECPVYIVDFQGEPA